MRVYTKMLPLEFVATPATSPRNVFCGIFRKSALVSKLISGTEV